MPQEALSASPKVPRHCWTSPNRSARRRCASACEPGAFKIDMQGSHRVTLDDIDFHRISKFLRMPQDFNPLPVS